MLDTSLRGFLDWLIWSGKAHPKCRWHLPVTTPATGRPEKKALLFAYLPSLLLTSSSILVVWLPHFYTDIVAFQEPPPDHWWHIRTDTSSPVALTASGFSTSQCESAVAGLPRPYCVSQTNQSPLIHLYVFSSVSTKEDMLGGDKLCSSLRLTCLARGSPAELEGHEPLNYNFLLPSTCVAKYPEVGCASLACPQDTSYSFWRP